MKYFRVYFGFGKDDFLSIPQTELPKAINAQVTGKVALLESGSIAGNNIHRIVPDYQREMGYHRDYQLASDDYVAIGNKAKTEFEGIYLLAKTNVERHIQGLPPLIKLEPSKQAIALAEKLAR